jgi:hypothetical protein
MITEPYTTKKKKEDSFDYESILPQDRLAQTEETGQPDINSQPPAAKPAPDDIWNKIYSYRPPAPTYDPNRPEELKRLARASAIGKGLNVLGDVIGLSADAPVHPRPKDEKELGYLQSMYNYVDDYNRRMDEWNWRDYLQKLKTGELALSEANLEKERKLQERMFESQEKRWELDYDADRAWELYQAGRDIKKEDLEREKFEFDKAYKSMTLEDQRIYRDRIATAAEIRAQKPPASTKTYKLYDSKGNSVKLDENERGKIMSLILEDPITKLTQDELDLLKPKLGQPFSTHTMNNIVQKYWEKTPSSRDYIYSKYGKPGQSGQETETKFDWGEFNRPEYKGPVRHEEDVIKKWGEYVR